MKQITMLIIAGLFLLQTACRTLTAPRHTPMPTPTPLNIGGPACFGSFGYGVTCLQNNEWIHHSRKNDTLSGDRIVNMAVCPGGEILVLHIQGADLFDGVL